MKFRKAAPTKKEPHIKIRYIGERRSWRPAYEIDHLHREFRGYTFIVHVFPSILGFNSLAEAKAWVSENQE